ncbi:alpha-galactosidase a precursor [Trichoderma arundinaceum]|uniref:Alpha-galactosidase a n=1 Tax=Trichoderma arundinaceum TaxID=490622 RepID=A0A395NPN5_TRIAR|nr:alpha-galactosidase a precursor [Trichoderma arundinaceum]
MDLIQVLQASVDPEGESEFRLFVNNKFVKYITMDGGLYDSDNKGHVSRNPTTGDAHFAAVSKARLPGITKLWHPTRIDHLELRMGRKLRSNVYEATCSRFSSTIIAKLARFPWEVPQLEKETTAYEWIDSHEIGPAFLGHLIEEGRVIGFIMARITDCRHATPDDFRLCCLALSKLHRLGIRQLYSGLHRPSIFRTTHYPPTRISQFNRPFMSSSSHEQTAPIGEEWHELSAEHQIQSLLDSGDTRWGWVIYRCTYKPELQIPWESFKRLVEYRTRKSIAESDAPDIAEKLDLVWIEDPELEGASRDELKRSFRAWVRAEKQNPDFNIHDTPLVGDPRHTFFIQIDEDALLSCLREAGVDLHGGHVNIVRGWEDPLPSEEATDGFGEAVDKEDWMKIQASMIEPEFYLDLYSEDTCLALCFDD